MEGRVGGQFGMTGFLLPFTSWWVWWAGVKLGLGHRVSNVPSFPGLE
jgi:hypothetical protein